ncbi:hypothetical protein HOK68_01320 [Candidatus Woesearchaeota archaeon]|jgi:hypothetical protein|nr:hypothetical protein [Candidatus Woesearchaeota archaeon]MBT4387435.1 hypothetical protein [Candidatus Woesearchaeota archaeon]MBT4595812.1 hypothetical protein [Candidatus Woesearchaeota archaeon]MBT5741339.1 hypothetical protein [Candidatus Woesearchaeota archaeon]MBT6505401.1 hypothetical protein [Candidatus Woesearchaeota archaeon]
MVSEQIVEILNDNGWFIDSNNDSYRINKLYSLKPLKEQSHLVIPSLKISNPCQIKTYGCLKKLNEFRILFDEIKFNHNYTHIEFSYSINGNKEFAQINNTFIIELFKQGFENINTSPYHI